MLYDINKNQAKPYPHHRKPYPKNLLHKPLTQKICIRVTVAQKSVSEKPYPEIRSPKKPSDKNHTQKSEARKTLRLRRRFFPGPTRGIGFSGHGFVWGGGIFEDGFSGRGCPEEKKGFYTTKTLFGAPENRIRKTVSQNHEPKKPYHKNRIRRKPYPKNRPL